MRQCAVAAYVVDILHNASLMSLQSDTAPHRASTTWSGLKGERLIVPSLQLSSIEQHLAQAGVAFRPMMVLDRLNTIVAMVEAGHGTGILPSHALPAGQRRRVRTSRLINPTVPIEFYQIRSRSRKLSAAAEECTTFSRAYIARWAGRAGLP
jgi:DNA-binding transcriptional LysR family regulator